MTTHDLEEKEEVVLSPEQMNLYMNSPFYQKKFPSGLNEFKSFKDIPLTKKSELRETKATDLLAVERQYIAHYHESSGTTGIASSSWFTRNDIARNASQINKLGIELVNTDLVLNRFPYSLFLPAFLIQEAVNQVQAGIVHASSRNSVATYPKVLELMSTLEVTVFAGIPRELELLAEAARLLEYDIRENFASLRGIIVAGDLLSPKRKAHIERLWGVPVFNLYGTTETGNIGVTCKSGILHYSPEDYYIELCDMNSDSYKALGERGQAIVTTLKHEGSPLLRYENGDVLSLHSTDCSCGISNWELHHYGRFSERIEAEGITLDTYDIQEVVYGLDIIPVAWQLRKEDEHIKLCLEYSDNQKIDSEAIQLAVKSATGIDIQCEFFLENTLLNRVELLSTKTSKKPQYVVKKTYSKEENLFEKGVKLFLEGSISLSHEIFEEIIQENGNHAEAYAYKAACLGKLIEQGNILTKVKYLPKLKKTSHQAVLLDRYSPLARSVYGLMLLKTPQEFGGDIEKALKQFKLSYYLGSEDPDLLYYMTEAYIKLDDIKKAKEIFAEAMSQYPDSKLLVELKKKLEKKG